MSRLVKARDAAAREAFQIRIAAEAVAIVRVFCDDIQPDHTELPGVIRNRIRYVMHWLPKVEDENTATRGGNKFSEGVQRRMMDTFAHIIRETDVDLRPEAPDIQEMNEENWWTGINIAHLLTMRVICVGTDYGRSEAWLKLYKHLNWLSDYTEVACPKALQRAWDLYEQKLR